MSSGTSPICANLNRSCFCIELDRKLLDRALEQKAGDHDFWSGHLEKRPNLFSNVPVFLPETDISAMLGVVQAMEEIARLPGYRDAVLGWAPEIARWDFRPRGVLMGYDFHLGSDGPKLIEINTNAGGAFLNALLVEAQRGCCPEVEAALMRSERVDFEAAVMRMFRKEYELQRKTGELLRIAIVDDVPEEQFLYPEFVLAQGLFQRHGIDATIVDPGSLSYESGHLSVDGNQIDLVYNRLVDFSLDLPEHKVLRQAYLDGNVVVTPNPHTHALFADKRNMTLLSDEEVLRSWGLSQKSLSRLAQVPGTVVVSKDNATQLWEARKNLYFKPFSGHGSKAVYRGDKLTKRVWDEIARGGYVAQDLVSPSQRMVPVDGTTEARKVDVRLYVYDGKLLLTAARLYQGQTTNFRTSGGGFAPVFPV